MNVRASSSSTSEKKGRVIGGDIVEVVEEEEGDDGKIWYLIRYDDNKEGYVRSDFVKKGRVRIRPKEKDLIDFLRLPVREQKYYFQPQLVVFPEWRQFPVYSGPGKDYIRGQDIALVSTNGKIQVFGFDGDWILIQYSIKGKRLRIGYIEAKYLPEEYLDEDGKPNPDMIQRLEFEYHTVTVKNSLSITDDPLVSQQGLADVEAGTRVTRLGYLEGWSHVELVERNGNVKVRGFIRNKDLED